MNREKLHNQALEVISNNKRCTIVSEMGTGKSWIIAKFIDGNLNNSKIMEITIILPKKTIYNLIDEFIKYGLKIEYHLKKDNYCVISIENITIHLLTIGEFNKQFVNKDILIIDEIQQVLIIDEIQEVLSPKRGEILLSYLKLRPEIQIIGLTGTPDDNKKNKKLLYDIIAPIKFRYHTAESDNIINKKKVFVFKYNLDNNYKFKLQKGNKTWEMGELDAYNYIQSTIDKSVTSIKQFYWEDVVKRLKILINSNTFQPNPNYQAHNITEEYKKFFNKLVSKDNLDLFKRCKRIFYSRFKILWDNKASTNPNQELLTKLNQYLGFYWMFKYIIDLDYAIFGMEHLKIAYKVPSKVRQYSFNYNWAIKERVRILSSLDSSATIAKKIKKSILDANIKNRVILFSKLSEQADKVSIYTIHSNNHKDVNKEILDRFKKGHIRELSSCKMAGLGLNFKNLQYGIMVDFNSSKVENPQKLARLNRLAIDEVAKAIFIIPKNTQSEIWFDNLEIKPDFIINNINELLNLIK